MGRLYQSLSYLLYPFLKLHFFRRLKRGREHPDRFQERFAKTKVLRPEGTLVWIHAASVGETLSSLPLIYEIQKQSTEATILLTTGTLSSAKIIEARQLKNVIHQFIPLDIPFLANRFLTTWKPDCILWFESELWPNILMSIKNRGIPAFLINGRLSDRSYRRWKKHPKLLTEMLEAFTHIFAQSQEHKNRFSDFASQRVSTLGNFKFASPPLPYKENELDTLKKATAGRLIWLAASTHEAEEGILFQTHSLLKKKYKDLLTILVPRHPERSADIEKEALAQRFSPLRRSEKKELDASCDFYIADTFNELGLFYRLAPIIFVGGSLAPHIGGHNIIEPAHFHRVILHGPHMANFRETDDLFRGQKGSLCVLSTLELSEVLDQFFSSPEQFSDIATSAFRIAQSQHGILNSLLEELRPFLFPAPSSPPSFPNSVSS